MLSTVECHIRVFQNQELLVLNCVETTVGEGINSAPFVLRASLEFWRFRTIKPQRSKGTKPSTYGRNSTYIPLNVNKGESSTFFSLIQGNSLVPVKQNQLRRRIAKYGEKWALQVVSSHDKCIGRSMETVVISQAVPVIIGPSIGD